MGRFSRPSPLTPQGARQSLAQRLAPRADRIRQRVAVHLGVRAYRVFLTWTKFGVSQDSERGDGTQRPLALVEILPSPRVSDLTAINYRSTSVGTVPEGSLRIDRISAFAYTEDALRGLKIPVAFAGSQPVPPPTGQYGAGGDEEFAGPVDFYWVVVEDGRGDDPPIQRRFRLLGDPFRRPDGAEWVVFLQRADRDPDRAGNPQGGGFPALP